jgi:hypothetical protein
VFGELVERARALGRQIAAAVTRLRKSAWARLGPARPPIKRVWRRTEPVLAWLLSNGRRLLAAMFAGIRWFCFGVWTSFRWIGRTAAVLFVVFLLFYYVIDTNRDVAYRYSAPAWAIAKSSQQSGDTAPNACDEQRKYAGILAEVSKAERAKKSEKAKNEEEDTANDEELAQSRLPESARSAFTCMLQTHEVPIVDPDHPEVRTGTLRYHLAFLEFTETGKPVEIGLDGKPLEAMQLDVLLKHLREPGKQNYVLVFIHGWRHDARIGDENVQSLRLYAAYAASFLNQRCSSEAKRYCDAVVTAVYVGWRGARVDERPLKSFLGQRLGGLLDDALAAPSLYDRKPVSERIAPAVASALESIDETLARHSKGKPWEASDRMLTIGHSLGGNVLASSFRDKMVERITRHEAGTVMAAPVGDLVVLLNPASEASNWTALQRAFQKREVLYGKDAQQKAARAFYPENQPPIYISLTAATPWPAGGVREVDYRNLRERYRKRQRANSAARIPDDCQLEKNIPDYRAKPRYDQATHDLFPLFRGDFRPLAEALEDWAQLRCERNISSVARMRAGGTSVLVKLLRNIPFMNTDIEQTRAIGHLIPMRPPYGIFSEYKAPATSVGTTHELIINQSYSPPPHYTDAGNRFKSECAIVDSWLPVARTYGVGRGMRWDSSYTAAPREPYTPPPNVTPVRDRRAYGERKCVDVGGTSRVWRTPIKRMPDHLESQLRHGVSSSGMRPIVAPTDPFWNVRAFDTALQGHSGYGSYVLMCTLQQLVMDRVGEPPKDMPKEERCSDPPAVNVPLPAPPAMPAPTPSSAPIP